MKFVTIMQGVVSGFLMGGVYGLIAMREDIEGLSAMETTGRAISGVKKLCSDVRVPQLRDLDIPEKEYFQLIPQMAKDGMESGTPLVNPRKPTEEDMVELFKKAY